MKLILKTLALLPIVTLLGTILYGLAITVIFMSYFVALFMTPTKLYGYLKELEAYKRIKH